MGVYQVIQATAANLSSMHQDVFPPTPTEIDFIERLRSTRKANSMALQAPVNSELYQQIKTLD
ncbi:ketopantoate reductase C-terminal domain-containing protein, partial [Klebsiella pneumoniae]|uniref:ketopantoate reductase C-terminal domain-containing protein n=1 Tax=Klebsiella pneumoniae TaxID=573 RepID=UPI002A188314